LPHQDIDCYNHFMSECVLISKGGVLKHRKWVYDEELKKGEYVVSDVTDQLLRRLFELCELEEGVTMRDVFLLAQRETEVINALIDPRSSAVAEEGLKPYERTPEDDEDGRVDYAELYWCMEEDDDDKTLGGYFWPDFHGVGVDKVGEPITWGIEMQPAYKNAHLPLVLNKEITISPGHKARMRALRAEKPIQHRKREGNFLLIHVLYGIFWELTFYGGPEDRDAFTEGLRASCAEIESGTASTTRWMERLVC
jgi:hypothetical protein